MNDLRKSIHATSFRRCFIFIIFIGFFCAQFSKADVLLSKPRNVEGSVIYPDHKDQFIYYYVPGTLQIKKLDGIPQFSFHRYRYIGTRATGDSGTFKGKGMISFIVEFTRDTRAIRKIEQFFKRENRNITLKSVPLHRVQSNLIYTTIEDNQSGKLEGGHWVKESKDTKTPKEPVEGVWEKRSFIIETSILTTNLLWESFFRGGVILSLNYSLIGRGKSDYNAIPEEIINLQDKASSQTKKDSLQKLEDIKKVVLSDSLVIKVLPSEFPGCFKSVDIGSRMPLGYTFLDVYCYDFQNLSQNQHLSIKVVEVRGTSVTGSKPVQKVQFSLEDPGAYKHSIRFPYAMNLDNGYDYRIIRINKKGEKSKGDWVHHQGWTGILDVTEDKSEKKDPRGLY